MHVVHSLMFIVVSECLYVSILDEHALMSSELDPGALPPQRPVHHGQVGFPGAALRYKRRADYVNISMQGKCGAYPSIHCFSRGILLFDKSTSVKLTEKPIHLQAIQISPKPECLHACKWKAPVSKQG